MNLYKGKSSPLLASLAAIQSNLIANTVFANDYLNLVHLKYIMDHLAPFPHRLRNEQLFRITQLLWQLKNSNSIFGKKIQSIQDWEKKITTHPLELLKTVLELSQAESFIPTHWANHYYCSGDEKFLSSAQQQLVGWSAHRDNHILAAAGPESRSVLANFFKMLYQQKVLQILALGSSGKDFINYLLPGTYENYQVETKKRYSARTISITNLTTHENHLVFFNQIIVSDNTSLNLNNRDLKIFLHVYTNSSADHPLLVHCASGAGRTGQVRLLFNLLQRLEDDVSFKEIIDSYLLSENNFDIDTIAICSMIFQEELNKLRKTRYAIQVEEQFINCVPLLLLLRAAQLQYPSHDLTTLRNKLHPIWRPTENFNVFTPFADHLPLNLILLPGTKTS